MELKNKTVDELQARLAEIGTEIDGEDANLDELTEETRSISDELEARAKAHAQKEEIRKAVANGDYDRVIETAPVMEEKREMKKDVAEIRSSEEYNQAFLSALQNGDGNFKECRALLATDQVTVDGVEPNVPVPTMLDNEIRTAWEESKILPLVGKVSFRGDYAVCFEVSATGAHKHLEGDAPIPEEEIILGVVKIENEFIKKWIPVTDKVLRGTTIRTADYLYREMAHKIVEEAEKELIDLIVDAPDTASKTAVGVPSLAVSELSLTTILELRGLLVSGARNLRLVMNRQTYIALRKLEFAASKYDDAFDGLKEYIIETDALPAYSAATEGQDFIIVGDFASGALINFPDGEGVEYIVDPYTGAQSNIVKITAKMFAGMGLVADKRFAVATKGAASNNG